MFPKHGLDLAFWGWSGPEQVDLHTPPLHQSLEGV